MRPSRLFGILFAAGAVACASTPVPRGETPVPAPADGYAWQALDDGLPRVEQWRDNLAIADVDGDGHPDLLLPPPRKGGQPAAIFRGAGKGHWQRWTDAHFPARYDFGGVAAADFDRDGKLDLALGVHLTGLVALRGDGHGNFSAASDGLPYHRPGEALGFTTRRVLAFDWNGDGRPDLIAPSEGMSPSDGNTERPALAIFLSGKNGWQPVPRDPVTASARLAAVDRDGRALVAAVEFPDHGVVRLQRARNGHWEPLELPGFPDDARLMALAVADRGSAFALAWQERHDEAWWVHVDRVIPDGKSARRESLAADRGGALIRNLVFATPTRGAAPVLVAVDERGVLRQFIAVAGGGDREGRPLPSPDWRTGCGGYGLAAADVDHDGGDEIAVSFAGEPDPMLLRSDCANGGGVEVFKLTATPGATPGG
jgi:hypothetical protein